MPGTPATTPYLGIPRYSDSDTASFSSQVNSISDLIDGSGAIYRPGDLIESYASTRTGAVLCDGTAYTLSAHPEMNALAAACPGLVNSGILTVPDLRGRSILGAGTGPGLSTRSVGQTGGEETHVLSTTEMPSHGHTVSDTGHTHSASQPAHAHTFNGGEWIPAAPANTWVDEAVAPGSAYDVPADNTGMTFIGATDAAQPGISVAASGTGIGIVANGGGAAHNTMHPFGVANIFIKL